MIEAEGTVGFSTQKGQEYPYIAVANTDLEIISALLRFVGGGRVSLKTAYVNKRVWVWTLAQWNNLAALVPQIRPWMTDKGDKLGRWF